MHKRIFAWRGGGHFRLLVDGPKYFTRMLEAINCACQTVDLELYLLEPGHCASALLQALTEASARGVQVRCVFDGFGSLSIGQTLSTLGKAGVAVRLYNPLRWQRGLNNLYRDHRKLLIVDQQCAFIGGMGATDRFWQPTPDPAQWHEVMVEARGAVVQDWHSLFDQQWYACLNAPVAKLGALTIKPPPRPQHASHGWARVAYADGAQHRDILVALTDALRHATSCIWLATPYFLPTWQVRRLLRKAAKRGVDVRLLLTGRHTDNPPVRYAGQRYYAKLLKAGVRIFEYQPRFLHLKMVLVDEWVSIGSCNFDHWNLHFNLDANIETLDASLRQEVAALFAKDFTQSLEITYPHWRARPWRVRVKQKLWGALERLALNLFRHDR